MPLYNIPTIFRVYCIFSVRRRKYRDVYLESIDLEITAAYIILSAQGGHEVFHTYICLLFLLRLRRLREEEPLNSRRYKPRGLNRSVRYAFSREPPPGHREERSVARLTMAPQILRPALVVRRFNLSK